MGCLELKESTESMVLKGSTGCLGSTELMGLKV
jgi:hypothetical protein